MATTSTGKNRWGISTLSKENRSIAYAEEVMMNKKTGELLIKTPENDIISYNYNSRLKTHLDVVTLMAYNLGIYGKIYSVDLTDLDLPNVLDFNKEISTSMTFDEDYTRCMISFDIDCLTVTENGLTNIRHMPDINYEITRGTTSGNDVTETYTEESVILNEFNTRIFNTTKLDTFNTIDFKFNISKNDGFLDGGKYRLILNSILIIVE